MKLKTHPQNLFALGAILLLIISFLVHEEPIDIRLHDTYFIISLRYLCWAFCIIQLLLWGVYKIVNPILFSSRMTWAHIILTTLIFLAIILFSWWATEFYSGRPRRYIDISNLDSVKTFHDTSNIIGFFLAIFVVGQVIFLINIMLGLIKRAF